jgi:hypothetical protein
MKKLSYIVLLFFSIVISCTKSELPPVGKGNFIEVTLSNNITAITLTSATVSSMYSNPNAISITERGVCWSTTTLPTTSNSKVTISGIGSSGSSYSVTISGLSHATKYYVRSYVNTSSGIFYSNEVIVTTITPQKPILTSIVPAMATITSNSAILGGVITSDGNAFITERGVCYSTSKEPTISNSRTSNGTGTGSYDSPVSGLASGTNYYARAYATNLAGTSYGNEVSFTTLAISVPIISTTSASNVTFNSATTGGTISSNGNAPIQQSGVCFSVVSNPTIAGPKTTDGSTSGSFTSKLTGLVPGTRYYVKAYATNTSGLTGYGLETSFTTDAISKPILNATTVSSITEFTASASSSISSNGNAPIQESGVCYSTSPNPTIANTKTNDGPLIGSFTSKITGLKPATTYYIKSYATNSAWLTGYGAETSFTTPTISKASLSTVLSSFTSTTAIVNGTINSNGNATITQSGVCYSTSPNPTINSSKTTDGRASGSWSSNISGLLPNVTYYARAYAVNSAGDSYGNEVTFKTLAATEVCSITSTTNGIWYIMSTSTATSYSPGDNYTIRFNANPNYNYTFGQALKVSLFLNETEVGNYGTYIYFGLGTNYTFQIPPFKSSNCYTIRVFKAESGGTTKVYISPKFRIN